jgi:threonine synthase
VPNVLPVAVRYTTDRAWRAIKAADGVAVSVSEQDGTIPPGASVVCLLTATGLKDPGSTLRRLPALTDE